MTARRAGSAGSAALGLVVVLLVLAGCAGTATAPPGPRLSPDSAKYLASPLEGYSLSLGTATARKLEEAHRGLLSGGSTTAAHAVAESLLAVQSDLEPALVLQAEATFVDEGYAAVVELLAPVTRRLPRYVAAQRLLGRAAELSGSIPAAHTAFAAVAGDDTIASEGADRTRERALEIIDHRLRESLRAGRLADAVAALERLREIDPESDVAWRAALDVGRVTGDPASELVAARHLAERFPGDADLQLRWSALESEVGDSGTGLRILQQLAESAPENAAVAEELARAQFRWRLDLLPDEVQAIAKREEISRSDFASLLFWLFPSVRYGATGDARIATDILDHPRREEIIRVVNLGLLEVDPGLHEFDPDRVLVRSEALTALLRLLARNEPPAACLGGRSLSSSPAPESVCRVAAACGLIEADAGCFPDASANGPWVVESGRKALDQLGV